MPRTDERARGCSSAQDRVRTGGACGQAQRQADWRCALAAGPRDACRKPGYSPKPAVKHVPPPQYQSTLSIGHGRTQVQLFSVLAHRDGEPPQPTEI